MTPSLHLTSPPATKSRIYATITVIDGQRHLKPAQVAFDRLLFNQPPHLSSERVEIIVTNGDDEHRRVAAVLPHDADATRIPIRLLPAN